MTQRLRHIGRVIVDESNNLTLAAPVPTDQIDKITTSIPNFFSVPPKKNPTDTPPPQESGICNHEGCGDPIPVSVIPDHFYRRYQSPANSTRCRTSGGETMHPEIIVLVPATRTSWCFGE